MVTARQKVLTYLTKNRTASAREISRSLKMSAATVRHHLRVLTSDGRLEMSSVRGREDVVGPRKCSHFPVPPWEITCRCWLTQFYGSRYIDPHGSVGQATGRRIRLCGSASCQATKSHRGKIKRDELSFPAGRRVRRDRAPRLATVRMLRSSRNILSSVTWMKHYSNS